MKKQLMAIAVMSLGVLMSGTGCHSTDSSKAEPEKEKEKEEAKAPAVPIPADSPFAKIKLGMSRAEVFDLIGQPTDTSAHVTGKAFIPYYYGGDTHRMEAIYKGQGRIVFAPRHAFTSDMEVVEIQYNPAERGYN